MEKSGEHWVVGNTISSGGVSTDIPFSGGLQTDRLRLRRIIARDAETIQALVSNWEVAKQTRSFPHPYTMQDALDFISTAEEDWASKSEYVLGIEHLGDEELIGVMSVTVVRKWFSKSGELGYWLGQDYWGQGLATEAVEAFLRYCRVSLKLKTLSAKVFIENEASVRLLKSQGFKKVRKQTEHLPDRGGKRKILHLRRVKN